MTFIYATEAQVKKIYALAKQGKLWDITKKEYISAYEISKQIWRWDPIARKSTGIKMLKDHASFFIDMSEKKERGEIEKTY